MAGCAAETLRRTLRGNSLACPDQCELRWSMQSRALPPKTVDSIASLRDRHPAHGQFGELLAKDQPRRGILPLRVRWCRHSPQVVASSYLYPPSFDCWLNYRAGLRIELPLMIAISAVSFNAAMEAIPLIYMVAVSPTAIYPFRFHPFGLRKSLQRFRCRNIGAGHHYDEPFTKKGFHCSMKFHRPASICGTPAAGVAPRAMGLRPIPPTRL